MTVAAGEFVALYGPCGSGKTTLMELIAGVRGPDSGSVLVDGRDVFACPAGRPTNTGCTQLGMVGQPHNLNPGARLSRTPR